MKKLAVVVASVAVGCTALRAGLAPNPAALPGGAGWFCYAASQSQWSGCNRSVEDCDKDRTQAQRLYQVDTFDFAKWGRCLPSPQAFCATYESADVSTGKTETFFGCFPDEAGCQGWAANPPSGAQKVSSCGLIR